MSGALFVGIRTKHSAAACLNTHIRRTVHSTAIHLRSQPAPPLQLLSPQPALPKLHMNHVFLLTWPDQEGPRGAKGQVGGHARAPLAARPAPGRAFSSFQPGSLVIGSTGNLPQHVSVEIIWRPPGANRPAAIYWTASLSTWKQRILRPAGFLPGQPRVGHSPKRSRPTRLLE